MTESVCPECGGHVVLTTGEYVCSLCGLVVDQLFQEPLEALDNNNSKSRGALGERLHIVDGLGSYIDYYNSRKLSDLKLKKISEKRRTQLRRLKNAQNIYARYTRRQTEYRILRILNQISSILNLPPYVRDNAAYLYKKIKNRYQAKIVNHVSLIAVCIILSIREQKHVAPLTLTEVCAAFQKLGHRVNERLITRTALKLRINLGYTLKVRKSEDYLTRMISTLSNNPFIKAKLSHQTPDSYWHRIHLKALELLNKIPKVERGGRNPYVFAASIIYAAERSIACEEKRPVLLTQKEIASILGVAEYSIRDHYQHINKFNLLAQGEGDNRLEDK